MLAELLSECFAADLEETWERERTATLTRREASRLHTRTRSVLGTPVRAFAVRLHATGRSLREITSILAELGVERSHGAVWNWVHRIADSVPDPPTAQPSRVAVDETAVKINGEWSWLYAAIDPDTKVILDVALFGRHGTDPAAAFLSGLDEKHDLSDTVFLVDQFGYRTALSRLGLSGQVDYTDRNPIEKWFHTLKMRVDRFHNSWVGSRRSVRQWLAIFEHYYNYLRPHQSLGGRTPVEEMLN
jgi:putative transposase